jgi:hypothetical protein
MENSVQEDYQRLIERFLRREIDAKEFEVTYLDRFKHDDREMSSDLFLALDELFADVDMFCADDELRDDEDLDEAELRRKCELSLAVIRG